MLNNSARFINVDALNISIVNYSYQLNGLNKIFFIFPVSLKLKIFFFEYLIIITYFFFQIFLNEKLLGYVDLNHELANCNTNLSPDFQLFLLNKIQFDPINYNSLIQSNLNGQIELVACQDIQSNEEIICWFSESYLKNIKSKKKKNFILRKFFKI